MLNKRMNTICLHQLGFPTFARPLRSVMAVLAVVLSLPVFAKTFDYKGLSYSVLDETNNTCETRAGFVSDGDFVAGNLYNGALEIPSSVSDGEKEYTVVGIGEYGFYRSDITKIILPETLTSIGSNAFLECASLGSISLPKSLTEIGEYAFSGCTVLTEITLPESLTQIRSNTFASCLKLTKVFIPESLTEISDEAFYNCISLYSINLPQSLAVLGERAF